MVCAEVAVAGKETAFNGGIVEAIIVSLKTIASDGEVLMGFDGRVLNDGVVAIVDEVVEWFDVVGDKLLLDIFNEGTFDCDDVPTVVSNFLEAVEGFSIETCVEAREKSMIFDKFKLEEI